MMKVERQGYGGFLGVGDGMEMEKWIGPTARLRSKRSKAPREMFAFVPKVLQTKWPTLAKDHEGDSL